MNIDEMPVLPRVKALPKEPLKRVLLAFLVAETSNRSSVTISQRQIAGKFNRSSHRLIGKHLEALIDAGFIEVAMESGGVVPHSYKRGAFFYGRTRDNERLISLSQILSGSEGLVSDWEEVSAWGHGALGPIGVLCVATLSRLEGPTAQPALKRYLEPLCVGSSVDKKLRDLRECGLVVRTSEGVALVADWERVLHRVLAKNPAGHLRKGRGDHRRKCESEANFRSVNRGCLSDEERRQMKSLLCVVCGIRRGFEGEHFPPKRFLDLVKERNHRAFLWAICRTCNNAESEFIKAMRECKPEDLKAISLKGVRDPLAAYVAYSNVRRQIFHDAVNTLDYETAERVVCEVLAFWHALETMGLTGYADRISAPVDGDLSASADVHPAVCASQLPLGVNKRYADEIPIKRRGHILVERVFFVDEFARSRDHLPSTSHQLRVTVMCKQKLLGPGSLDTRAELPKLRKARLGTALAPRLTRIGRNLGYREMSERT